MRSGPPTTRWRYWPACRSRPRLRVRSPAVHSSRCFGVSPMRSHRTRSDRRGPSRRRPLRRGQRPDQPRHRPGGPWGSARPRRDRRHPRSSGRDPPLGRGVPPRGRLSLSASPHETIPELRDFVAGALDGLSGAHGVEFGMFGQYMALSRIKFLWIPSGEWARVDAELLALGGVTSEGSSWLVWREIATGMALRRGNLDAADDGLSESIEKAVASGEPQRIIPMASVVLLERLSRAIVRPSARSPRRCSRSSATASSGRRSRAPRFRAPPSSWVSTICYAGSTRRWLTRRRRRRTRAPSPLPAAGSGL